MRWLVECRGWDCKAWAGGEFDNHCRDWGGVYMGRLDLGLDANDGAERSQALVADGEAKSVGMEGCSSRRRGDGHCESSKGKGWKGRETTASERTAPPHCNQRRIQRRRTACCRRNNPSPHQIFFDKRVGASGGIFAVVFIVRSFFNFCVCSKSSIFFF